MNLNNDPQNSKKKHRCIKSNGKDLNPSQIKSKNQSKNVKRML